MVLITTKVIMPAKSWPVLKGFYKMNILFIYQRPLSSDS